MEMNAVQGVHTIGGDGETSYASNSRLQGKAIVRTKPMLENAIQDIYTKLLPERLVAVDLGCSSGPNTLLFVSHVLDVVGDLRRRLKLIKPPEVQFFLNDLPGNDFNNVFRSLKGFEKKMEEEKGDLLVPHYVAGSPGSFYGRLFPSLSVHFFHSSYCLHWLSQVPQGLEDKEGVPLNKGNIYITETSPPQVVEAYQKQFRRDFSTFLKSRYEELINEGRIILAFLGRKKEHPDNSDLRYLFELLAEALNSMASEGIIAKDKVDNFNVPCFGASMDEVKSVILSEGLFDLEEAHIFQSNWDPFDDSDDDLVLDYVVSGNNTVKCLRAVLEPLIANHFGDALQLDDLFSRYAKNIADHLLKEKTKYTVFVVALKKRA
ncbi:anthranilate O-methyltransferase 3 [Canna indica]|uniref:Anthranilate O-methyltransferase 3 n=1 Tax=Canna indica TaxID=4628 RepID=A0AAQ3QK09_9LILI|nr:anthranilate O-methyltransferase 3 [Canna indica]